METDTFLQTRAGPALLGCQSEGLCPSPLQFRGSSSWSWLQMCPEGSQDSLGAELGIFTLAESQGCLYALRSPAHGAVGKRSDVQPCCRLLGCLRGALLSVSPPCLCLGWLLPTMSPRALCVAMGKDAQAWAEASASGPPGSGAPAPLSAWPSCCTAGAGGEGHSHRRSPREELVASLSCSLTHLGSFESSL